MTSKNKNGFTLIETLVAVLLLAITITGPLTIASKGLTATMVAKDQFIGFYLAQDAIEQVRFLRDSSCLASGGGPTGCPSASWLSGLGSCVSADGSASCYIDSVQGTVGAWASCPTSSCILNYDSGNKYFSYTSGSRSAQQFIRIVKIQNDPAGASPDEAVVTVEVNWSDRAGITRVPIKVRENIFRWQ